MKRWLTIDRQGATILITNFKSRGGGKKFWAAGRPGGSELAEEIAIKGTFIAGFGRERAFSKVWGEGEDSGGVEPGK